MYARIASLVTLPGKREQLCTFIEEEISPVVQKQHGFLGHIILTHEREPRCVTVLSLWRRRTDAEVFRATVFNEVLESVKPLLATEPVITPFDCFSIIGRRESEKPNLAEFPPKEHRKRN